MIRLPSRTPPFEVKVVDYNATTGFAKVVDEREIDNIIPYELFVPAYFGGQAAPYPKVEQKLLIVYDTREKHIVEAWHPKQPALA